MTTRTLYEFTDGGTQRRFVLIERNGVTEVGAQHLALGSHYTMHWITDVWFPPDVSALLVEAFRVQAEAGRGKRACTCGGAG